VQRALYARKEHVLVAWLERADIKWNDAQIQQGLTHESKKVRQCWEKILQRQYAAESQSNETDVIMHL